MLLCRKRPANGPIGSLANCRVQNFSEDSAPPAGLEGEWPSGDTRAKKDAKGCLQTLFLNTATQDLQNIPSRTAGCDHFEKALFSPASSASALSRSVSFRKPAPTCFAIFPDFLSSPNEVSGKLKAESGRAHWRQRSLWFGHDFFQFSKNVAGGFLPSFPLMKSPFAISLLLADPRSSKNLSTSIRG